MYNNNNCYDNGSYSDGATIYWVVNISIIIWLTTILIETTHTYIWNTYIE